MTDLHHAGGTVATSTSPGATIEPSHPEDRRPQWPLHRVGRRPPWASTPPPSPSRTSPAATPAPARTWRTPATPTWSPATDHRLDRRAERTRRNDRILPGAVFSFILRTMTIDSLHTVSFYILLLVAILFPIWTQLKNTPSKNLPLD